MPIATTCGNCGKTVNVPDAFARRKGRCKGCGGAVPIPSAPPVVAFAPDDPDPVFVVPPIRVDDDDEEAGDPVPRSIKSAPAPASSRPGPALPPMSREPRYYRFLSVYGYVLVDGGLATWAIWAAFVLVVMIAGSGDREFSPGAILAAIVQLGPPTLVLVSTLTVGSVILLAVDSARNLRVIRLQGHMAAGG